MFVIYKTDLKVQQANLNQYLITYDDDNDDNYLIYASIIFIWIFEDESFLKRSDYS